MPRELLWLEYHRGTQVTEWERCQRDELRRWEVHAYFSNNKKVSTTNKSIKNEAETRRGGGGKLSDENKKSAICESSRVNMNISYAEKERNKHNEMNQNKKERRGKKKAAAQEEERYHQWVKCLQCGV